MITGRFEVMEEFDAELLKQLITESGFNIGDIVIDGKRKYKLVEAKLYYDKSLKWYGHLIRKNGTLGSIKYQLYSKWFTKC
jgi:hypothetical protein